MLSARPRDSSRYLRLTDEQQPRTTRLLRSAPITGASSLLRAGPPARHGNGTHVPTGHSRLGHSLSPHADAAVSGHAFSRSAREPQTGLMPPLRRTPPGREAGTRQAPPGTHTVAPVLMSSERVTTLQQWSSSRSPPDASRAPFPHRSPRRSSANAA